MLYFVLARIFAPKIVTKHLDCSDIYRVLFFNFFDFGLQRLFRAVFQTSRKVKSKLDMSLNATRTFCGLAHVADFKLQMFQTTGKDIKNFYVFTAFSARNCAKPCCWLSGDFVREEFYHFKNT
jgi:hypothetical protein